MELLGLIPIKLTMSCGLHPFPIYFSPLVNIPRGTWQRLANEGKTNRKTTPQHFMTSSCTQPMTIALKMCSTISKNMALVQDKNGLLHHGIPTTMDVIT